MSELKIIGTVQYDSKHFKTTDEFNKYYLKNKEEMEEMTTQKLNKLYTIDGYRITKIGTRDKDGKRIKGSICLKKIPESEENLTIEEINGKFENKIHDLETKIKVLTNSVNKLIETINSS